MVDIPTENLWQWWCELIRREIELEHQYKPLIEQRDLVHGKRLALENLMSQGRLPAYHQELASELEKLSKEDQMPSTERKPPDVAYDVLLRRGVPMHYRAILEEINKQGVVIGGRDPGTTLIAYLGRDKRFAKARDTGRGFWKLGDQGHAA